MSTPTPGKPDASAFLSLVGDYHIGVYGKVEVIRARLLPGVRGTDRVVLEALEAWGGQAYGSLAGRGLRVPVPRDSAEPRVGALLRCSQAPDSRVTAVLHPLSALVFRGRNAGRVHPDQGTHGAALGAAGRRGDGTDREL